MLTTTARPVSFSSVAEVLDAGLLSWEAQCQPLITGSGLDVKSHKAIVRSDNNFILSIMGINYTPVQQSDGLAVADMFLQSNPGSKITRVHEFEGGRRVGITVTTLKIEAVKKGDEIQHKLSFWNAHDGSAGVSMSDASVRLVCLNEMTREEKGNYFSTRHTKNVRMRFEDAFKIFAFAQKSFMEFIVTAKRLEQTIIDKAKVTQFIKEVFEVKEDKELTEGKRAQMNQVYRLFQEGKGNSGRSLWDAYNGVTEYVDHFTKQGHSEDIREQYAMIGAGAKMKARAWELVNR